MLSVSLRCRCASYPLTAQTAVDDPVDTERVNCVLTSLIKEDAGSNAQVIKDADKAEVGTSLDLGIAELISVEHAIRMFKPSAGIEIVAKVVPAAKAGAAKPAASSFQSAEVFAFQWRLANGVRLLQDIESRR